ncbi:MAG TPA: M48 family metallopeptidase [Kofleriaceae bacterium]|nr:M48 family metallopeptidase [Kofleriaceae bacterium]
MVRAALLLALAACAHHDACGTQGTLAFDRCIGNAMDTVLVTSGTYAEVDDDAVRAYVSAVGMRLVRAAGDHGRWRFRVVDDTQIGGEANVGSTIYVTRGALAALRNEAELAGLLGHEIGHVLAGHGHDAVVERARDLATDTHDRDRDDEVQADELAVLLTARAGYDPRAVETMLRALGAGDPPGDDRDIHPPWRQRLARVRAFAMQLPAGGELGEAAFAAHMRTLVVGDDPRGLSARGATIVLARANLAIDLPAGSQIDTASGNAVAAVAGSVLIVKPITRSLVKVMKPERDAAKLMIIRDGPRGGALIAIVGPQPAAALARLHVRAPRPEELATVVPRHFDPSAKRPLRDE